MKIHISIDYYYNWSPLIFKFIDQNKHTSIDKTYMIVSKVDDSFYSPYHHWTQKINLLDHINQLPYKLKGGKKYYIGNFF